MAAAESTQAVSQRKVVYDAHPELIGQVEALSGRPRQALQLQKRDRWQHQRPHFLQVAETELERLHHRSSIGCRSARRRHWSTHGNGRPRATPPLPQRSVERHLRKQRPDGLGYDRAESHPFGGTVVGVYINLAYSTIEDRSFSSRPKGRLPLGD